MLNDIKPPPLDINGPDPNGHRPSRTTMRGGQGLSVAVDERFDSPTHSRPRIETSVDRQEPGTHHARYVGERGATDAVYDMPLEDRASSFSIALSVVVMSVFIVVMLALWWTMR